MMKMSRELQKGIRDGSFEKLNPWRKASGEALRVKSPDGNGEPNADSFWLGGYNEVLINTTVYAENLPWSIAGVFEVQGGDPGSKCALRTRCALIRRYGDEAKHIPLLALDPSNKKEAFSLLEDEGCETFDTDQLQRVAAQ